jgi:hypothetical protein
VDIEDKLKSVPLPKPDKRKNKLNLNKSLKASLKRKKQLVKREINDLMVAEHKKKVLEEALAKTEELEKVLAGKQPLVKGDVLAAGTPVMKEAIGNRPVAFMPNPGPQTDFLAATEKEVFYGGARGGGKSYSLIVDCLRDCDKPDHVALVLRRTMPELRDLIRHSQRLYPTAYPGAKWREQQNEWTFPSGARIEFGYAESTADALRYQGRAYTWIGVDELPQYPDPQIWTELRGSLRTGSDIKTYMRATGNPGNVGSAWVKEMFIDPAPPNTRFEVGVETPNGKSVFTRRFIPASLFDNPHLMKTDDYLVMLSSLPETKRRQWLDGDWDAWDGAAFPEFRREIHVVKPFEIPTSWVRFRACDWGYSSPACCLWFAVDYDNNLYVYKELYVNGSTGRKYQADTFAQKVREMEKGERVLYGVLDSSVWSKRGDIGPSIVDTMKENGCHWRPSDRSPNSRKNGKMEVHRRLHVRDLQDGKPKPSLFFFDNCRQVIKDLPTLPLDENDPEDVDTKAIDHSYDALRYGCMSRPMNPTKMEWINQQIAKEKFHVADGTFGY